MKILKNNFSIPFFVILKFIFSRNIRWWKEFNFTLVEIFEKSIERGTTSNSSSLLSKSSFTSIWDEATRFSRTSLDSLLKKSSKFEFIPSEILQASSSFQLSLDLLLFGHKIGSNAFVIGIQLRVKSFTLSYLNLTHSTSWTLP